MNRQWKGIFPRLFAAALILGASPTLGQAEPDGHFDWPMGLEAGGESVPGFRLRVVQNFHNMDGPALSSASCPDGVAYTCGRAHAGVDLALSEGDTAESLVRATADGVVECVTSPYPGRVVVIRHDNPDGSRVYSQYGHLNLCASGPGVENCPAPGERVERGNPIGTVLDQGTNSHLHFEIRTFPYWDYSYPQGPSHEPDDHNLTCAGRGYASDVEACGEPLPLDPGYLNPVDYVLSRRPPAPDAIHGELVVRQEPDDGAAEVAGADRIVPVAAVRDADFDCLLTASETDRECPEAGAVRCPTSDGNNVDRLAFCQESSGDDCLNGACDWWYEVSYAAPGSDEPATGYVKAFTKIGYGAAIHAGEPLRQEEGDVGRWQEPGGEPIVELPLLFDELDGRRVPNQGTAENMDGRVAGALLSGEVFPGASVVRLDGATSFVEVENSLLLRSAEGFQLSLWVWRRSNDDEDVLAGQWDVGRPEGQRWLLTFGDQGDGELRLSVRLADGEVVTAKHVLPDCAYLGRGVRLAASYAPDDGLRLYWNRRQVAHRDLGGRRLADGEAPLLVGGTAGAGDADVARLDGDVFNFRFWGEPPEGVVHDLAFVIDTTGSMSDDIASVKASAAGLVDAIFDLSPAARVAVTDFRDFPVFPYGSAGDYPFKVGRSFTGDRGAVVGGIESLALGHGGDFPESVFSGLMGAIEAQEDAQGLTVTPWRLGAVKSVILMGDAPAHDPEPFTGYTLGQVTAAARAGGVEVGNLQTAAPSSWSGKAAGSAHPIRIFAVLIGGDPSARATYRALAEGTDGQLIEAASASEVVDALLEAIGAIGGPANQPPETGAALASVPEIWPPNHKMVPVHILGVTDPEGDAFTVTVTGITQDEPVAGPGRHSPDGGGVGTDTALLRAERDGGGTGRVYEISFAAVDERGAEATGTVTVCVPHGRGAGSGCVDEGQLHDSTTP